ncbi:MAG TPA: hypothetical protein VFC59_11260 [Cryobacterium sp.]|nr:hypothetical protein [Cryobacterium sp.]
MNKNQTSTASTAFRKKRLAVGAVSVLAAGALLGLGVQGATAAPLNPTSSSTATTDAIPGFSGTFLASLTGELRADLAQGHDVGEKAQNIAETIAGHAALFASLPANLQADLTTLKDASAADRTAAAQTIETTALAGGYGEQIKKLATEIQKHPEHPLAGLLPGTHPGHNGHHAKAQAQDAGQAVVKMALRLVDIPAVFSQLPAQLQSDLTDLKNAPAAEQAADAKTIETAALNGDYGQVIQAIAERLVAGADAKAGAHAKAGADTDAGSGTDADAGADANVSAGH